MRFSFGADLPQGRRTASASNAEQGHLLKPHILARRCESETMLVIRTGWASLIFVPSDSRGNHAPSEVDDIPVE